MKIELSEEQVEWLRNLARDKQESLETPLSSPVDKITQLALDGRRALSKSTLATLEDALLPRVKIYNWIAPFGRNNPWPDKTPDYAYAKALELLNNLKVPAAEKLLTGMVEFMSGTYAVKKVSWSDVAKLQEAGFRLEVVL